MDAIERVRTATGLVDIGVRRVFLVDDVTSKRIVVTVFAGKVSVSDSPGAGRATSTRYDLTVDEAIAEVRRLQSRVAS